MVNKHRIVVSAENNPYAAWMAKLFYFSCISRLNHSPIIIVHETGRAWHPDFCELVKFGASVRGVPSYRVTSHGDVYFPRNTAGTLLHAAEMCGGKDEFIVLCDPDMIFVRQPDFPESLAADHYAYMTYDRAGVEAAREKMGITLDAIDAQRKELCCGVPYVIPVADAHKLAEAWLMAVDAFPPREWEDIMYAFGLAVVELGLRITPTHMMSLNNRPGEAWSGDVIHYCYGDDIWNKRHYFTEEQARKVWNPSVEASKGTILEEILSQIREARDFYRDFYF